MDDAIKWWYWWTLIMKCIQCQTDNNLQERTEHQGRCKNCGHPFAFEPTSMGTPTFTDPFFAKAIADISANGTLFFTPKQLVYLLNRRLRNRSLEIATLITIYIIFSLFVYVFLAEFLSNFYGKFSIFIISNFLNISIFFVLFKASKSNQNSPKVRQINAILLQVLGGFIIVTGIYLSIAIFNSFGMFAVAVLLGMLSIYLGIRQLQRQKRISQSFLIAQSQVENWLNRWQEINGNSEKMLPSPREENTEAEISPDISAYSFDRVVVCGSATIAQLLISNNFHFENNCAVLSINGYPKRIFRTVLQMLKRNPELKVYALHDSSPRGVRLLHHLRTSRNWFAESTVTIYDLGLLPRHVLNSKRNFFVRGSEESAQQAKQLSPDVRQNLSVEELEWLELGNFVELESFTPRKLLQIVTQGIARRQLSPDGTDSAFVEIDSDSSSGEAYLLASESFG
ncbi:MAG: hypothetical protein RH949_08435 [Coleofasciculus sp. A1-SPW-01]|uniref:hypothetical protein n=1 Tax=Coleofasciculus sp. A1-SPW-01 TaxID=3070819 RepID=UPI0032F2269B